MVNIESVIAICEDEASEETGEPEPEPEAVADNAPSVIEQIADANGVDSDDITVVINGESAAYICECAINESKANRGRRNGGKSARKAKILAKVAKALKGRLKVTKKKGRRR